MRILLLSDIHSNLEALEACLAAAPEHDRVFNLGDVVGYGASPNEVTVRVRLLGERTIQQLRLLARAGKRRVDEAAEGGICNV